LNSDFTANYGYVSPELARILRRNGICHRFRTDGISQRTLWFGTSDSGSLPVADSVPFEIVDEATAAIGPNGLAYASRLLANNGGIHDGSPLELFTFVIR